MFRLEGREGRVEGVEWAVWGGGFWLDSLGFFFFGGMVGSGVFFL